MDGLFASLDHDWHDLVGRRSTRHLFRAWQGEDHVFAGHASLDEVISALRRQHHPADADLVLAALARRAGTDDLAARALLQAILPGLRSLAAAHFWLAPRDDLEAGLVALAWEHVRNYPLDARPRRIAANLLLDTGHHLRRQLAPSPAAAEIDAVRDSASTNYVQPAAEELTQLVVGAVQQGNLRPGSAALILRTRVLDEPVHVEAERLGYPPDTIRHRRRRAERALRATA